MWNVMALPCEKDPIKDLVDFFSQHRYINCVHICLGTSWYLIISEEAHAWLREDMKSETTNIELYKFFDLVKAVFRTKFYQIKRQIEAQESILKLFHFCTKNQIKTNNKFLSISLGPYFQIGCWITWLRYIILIESFINSCANMDTFNNYQFSFRNNFNPF